MELVFENNDLVRVKSGSRKEQVGRVIDRECSEREPFYQVEFPNDPRHIFFFEDELEKVMTMPCPRCLLEEKETQLSVLYHTEEGWAQDCPIHGRLYLWGHWRAEDGEVKDLLSGKSLKI